MSSSTPKPLRLRLRIEADGPEALQVIHEDSGAVLMRGTAQDVLDWVEQKDTVGKHPHPALANALVALRPPCAEVAS